MSHSAADWAYTVSEAVASYTLTGIIGFIVVKQLKLQDRIAEVPWSEVRKTSTFLVAFLMFLFGLGLLAGNWLGDAQAK